MIIIINALITVAAPAADRLAIHRRRPREGPRLLPFGPFGSYPQTAQDEGDEWGNLAAKVSTTPGPIAPCAHEPVWSTPVQHFVMPATIYVVNNTTEDPVVEVIDAPESHCAEVRAHAPRG
jgi:hypothetical protein